MIQGELYYYDTFGKKWVELQQVSINLENPEMLIDLSNYFNTSNGLYTKKLKIVPISYQIAPVFHIEIYGKGELIVNNNSSENVPDISSSTVKYTFNIEQQNEEKKIKSGYKYRYKGDYRMDSRKSKYIINRDIKRMCQKIRGHYEEPAISESGSDSE